MCAADPERTEGLEIYSTVLWHLKRETELGMLAKSLLANHRLAPETSCVVGNCFSLQKDPMAATRFFERSIQIDPRFAYAYTLCGHELIACDELDKAVLKFLMAIEADPLHYNAWYGLGLVKYRQGSYKAAAQHFARAVSINPRSSVLYCFAGMALSGCNMTLEAMAHYERSIKLDPKNNMAAFKLANLIIEKDRKYLNMAEEILSGLVQRVPNEPQIWFLLGRLKLLTGDRKAALVHFTWALDHSGKDLSFVKSIIDQIDTIAESDDSDDNDGDAPPSSS
eukprot:TRINITY_DN6927_c0_g1_i4.p2 TRINITY_DN6927_c0_g1~~TRINITY_DN6927_c0_g1_i4.p2  ORF type:complete len:281 (-),score=73.93 TRINITY_DN6927_c0_g1_i4:56-898(-)